MRLPVTIGTSCAAHKIYLETYKEWLSEKNIAKNTQRVYYSRIKQFLLFREYANMSGEPLHNLNTTKEAIDLYLNFLKQSKSKAKSINANIDALQNFAQFLGLNIIEIKRERCYYKQPKILSKKEQDKFLIAARSQKSTRDRALAMVLLYTGLRIGDCAQLSVQDVCIQNDLIDDTVAYLCLKKRASSYVTKIPLNLSTSQALNTWLNERQKIAIDSNNTALWLTQKGKRLSASGITFVIKRVGWQAQLLVSAETLRRTWLAGATDQSTKRELATKYGGHISAATIKKQGIILPGE